MDSRFVRMVVTILAGVVALGAAYLLALYLILYVGKPDFSPFFAAVDQASREAREAALQNDRTQFPAHEDPEAN